MHVETEKLQHNGIDPENSNKHVLKKERNGVDDFVIESSQCNGVKLNNYNLVG